MIKRCCDWFLKKDIDLFVEKHHSEFVMGLVGRCHDDKIEVELLDKCVRVIVQQDAIAINSCESGWMNITCNDAFDNRFFSNLLQGTEMLQPPSATTNYSYSLRHSLRAVSQQLRFGFSPCLVIVVGVLRIFDVKGDNINQFHTCQIVDGDTST